MKAIAIVIGLLSTLSSTGQVSEIIPARQDEYKMVQYFVHVGFGNVFNNDIKAWDGLSYGTSIVFKKGIMVKFEHHIKTQRIENKRETTHGINWGFGFLIRGGQGMNYKKYGSD